MAKIVVTIKIEDLKDFFVKLDEDDKHPVQTSLSVLTFLRSRLGKMSCGCCALLSLASCLRSGSD